MITASAPGKLVLMGEYAVLHGHPAVVAAVDVRAVCTVEGGPLDVVRDQGGLVDAVLAEAGAVEGAIVVDTAAFSAGNAKYGLGSSAAACVALLRALLPHVQLDELHVRAQRAHRNFQRGRGSGVDVCASVYGGITRYVRKNADEFAVAPVGLPAGVSVVPVWTGSSADTRAFIAAVERVPQLDRLLAGLAAATLRFEHARHLMEIVLAVNEARSLLQQLGREAGVDIVSEAHQAIHEVARSLGAVGKPSGSGGGDVSLIFCAADDVAACTVAVERRGFRVLPCALGVACVKGDVGDVGDLAVVKDAVAGRDVVFHVAARAGVWGKAKDYEAANIDGTQNVIDACLARAVSRLVHTSSPSVTFDGDAKGADESLPYARRHLYDYGRTKALAERRVLSATAQPHKKGPGVLLTTALRPHLIYGPGDPHILPRLVTRHKQGRLRIVGDGDNTVDLTFVDNGAHAHLLAADALDQQNPKNAGRAYFISDDAPVVPWRWLNTLFAALGLPPLTKKIPYPVAVAAGAVLETAWRAFDLKGEPPMTRFVAAQLGTSHHYSMKNARAHLGYEPLVDPGAALQQTVAWLQGELGAGRL
jgi:nucleoside-diphosphate-sugar epimerase